MATFHNRFIPREELHSFSAWNFGSLDGEQAPAPEAESAAAPEPVAPPPPPAPTAEEIQAMVQEARQCGYKDGYRDGLVALDNFKQSYAAQVTQQVAAVVQSFQDRLTQVEQQLAGALAQVAVEVARQVVRAELSTQPRLIEAVAQEALSTLVHSARYVRVRVHPDDHQLLVQQGQLDLEARHARLVPDASVQRGGCVVESDIGVVDASVEARWRNAAAQLGQTSEWLPAGPQAGDAA
jgi:flagellar assembly protein FliH